MWAWNLSARFPNQYAEMSGSRIPTNSAFTEASISSTKQTRDVRSQKYNTKKPKKPKNLPCTLSLQLRGQRKTTWISHTTHRQQHGRYQTRKLREPKSLCPTLPHKQLRGKQRQRGLTLQLFCYRRNELTKWQVVTRDFPLYAVHDVQKLAQEGHKQQQSCCFSTAVH